MTIPPAPGSDAPVPPTAPATPPAAPAPYPGGYTTGYATAPAPTNTLAIVALILGFLVPVGGIICGHIALSQIKRTGEGGHGLALAGTIVGYALVALGLIIAIVYLIVIVAIVGTAASHGYSS